MDNAMDLENLLKSYNYTLSGYLNDIKNFSYRVWEKPHLQWFTKHDVTHSEEIIYLIGQIIEPIKNDREIFLSEHELFILLASTYLHDIGMQYLKIPGYSIDKLSSAGYDSIRKKHAEESYNIILKRVMPSLERDDFHFPTIDEEYLPIIAKVSKGHSTDFFEEIVRNFKKDPSTPKGRKVRGEFLTALLLIGDELDLQCKRVSFSDTAKFTLSDFSSLHWYKHHYVDYVEILNGIIKLTLRFPENSDNYSGLIKRFIEDKLIKQVKKVNPTLLDSTKRKLSFSEDVNIQIKIDETRVKRSIPEGALRELKEEIRKIGANLKEKMEGLKPKELVLLKAESSNKQCRNQSKNYFGEKNLEGSYRNLSTSQLEGEKEKFLKIKAKNNEDLIQVKKETALIEGQLIEHTKYKLAASWLKKNKTQLSKRAALHGFPNLSEEELNQFSKEIGRYLDLVHGCLLVERLNLLDEPIVIRSFPLSSYLEAFKFIINRIPDRLPDEVAIELKEHLNYLMQRLL